MYIKTAKRRWINLLVETMSTTNTRVHNETSISYRTTHMRTTPMTYKHAYTHAYMHTYMFVSRQTTMLTPHANEIIGPPSRDGASICRPSRDGASKRDCVHLDRDQHAGEPARLARIPPKMSLRQHAAMAAAMPKWSPPQRGSSVPSMPPSENQELGQCKCVYCHRELGR